MNMMGLLRFLISGVLSCVILLPLMWEDWFSWRMLLVGSILLGLWYSLFCVGQENNLKLVHSLLDRMERIMQILNNRDGRKY